MSRPIEDYALVGDLQSAALVSRDGSIDWLCLPRFDSEACFAALLGDERHGYWQIAPARELTRVSRRYRPGTLILETEFATASGVVRLIDCMPPRGTDPVLIRLIEGVAGRVDMRMTLAARFEYGQTLPRVRPHDTARRLAAGAQSLWVFSPLELHTRDADLVARFPVSEGDRIPVAAVWRPSHRPAPAPPPASALVEQTGDWWRTWVAGLRRVDAGEGESQDAVIRSLITLKALSYAPTGGLISAPTTSLPQQSCGMRNWDYRYCWVRDAADAVDVFLAAGADEEAASLLNWLGHAVGGPAAKVQPVYRVAGERRIPEMEAHWLPGYENAQPVRVGNAAADAAQLGTFGDVLRARLAGRAAGLHAVRGRGGRAAGLRGHPLVPGVALAGPGRGDLGDARAAPAVRRHQGDDLGRGGLGRQDDRGVRGPRAGRALAAAARRRPRRRAATRLRPGPEHVHPALRLRLGGRQPAPPPAARVPVGRRSPDGRDGGGHRPGTGRQRRAAALSGPAAGRHGRAAARRGRVPARLVLAGAGARGGRPAGAGPPRLHRAARTAQRRGAAGRGLRPAAQAVRGQLPAGRLAHRTGHDGPGAYPERAVRPVWVMCREPPGATLDPGHPGPAPDSRGWRPLEHTVPEA